MYINNVHHKWTIQTYFAGFDKIDEFNRIARINNVDEAIDEVKKLGAKIKLVKRMTPIEYIMKKIQHEMFIENDNGVAIIDYNVFDDLMYDYFMSLSIDMSDDNYDDLTQQLITRLEYELSAEIIVRTGFDVIVVDMEYFY